MQCGRVGGCLLYLRSSRSNDFEVLFLCPYSSFYTRYTLLYTYLILYIVCCVIVIRNFVPPKYRKVKLPGQSWQSGYDKVVIPSYDKTCSHVLTNKHVLLFLCLTKKIALNRTYRTESYDWCLECCNFAEDRQHFKSLSTFALHFLCKCNPTGTCPTSIHKRIAHTRLHALTKAITRKVSRE